MVLLQVPWFSRVLLQIKKTKGDGDRAGLEVLQELEKDQEQEQQGDQEAKYQQGEQLQAVNKIQEKWNLDTTNGFKQCKASYVISPPVIQELAIVNLKKPENYNWEVEKTIKIKLIP